MQFKSHLKMHSTTYSAFILLLLIIFIVYHSALTCYFAADDYWHLPLIYQCFNGDPQLLFQPFTGPWANKSNLYLFYRPVTELSLIFDYLLYQGTAWGYHFSNLLYHWINTCFVFVLARLAIRTLGKTETSTWSYQTITSLAVAMIFALHPINTAPVVWILARADLVGCLFCLASLTSLIFYFREQKSWLKLVSISFYILALFSKESSVVLAPVILAITLYYKLKENKQEKISLDKLIETTIKSIKDTLTFWVVLLAYLIIRSIAIGDFVGGYQGSTAYILKETFWIRLLSPLSYWKLVHPFNSEVFESSTLSETILRSVYIATSLLILGNAFLSDSIEKRSKVFFYCLSILVLLLAISIPVWSINDMLHGSRMAYLMMPLVAMAFVLILLPYPINRIDKVLFSIGIIITLFLSSVLGYITTKNMNAWIAGGDTAQKIRTQVVSKLKVLDPSKKIAIYNLPKFKKGTFLFYTTDYVQGLFKPPLTKDDLTNRIICLDGPYIQGASVNYQGLSKVVKDKNIELAKWNTQNENLEFLDKDKISNSIKSSRLIESILPIKPIGEYKKLVGKKKNSTKYIFENTVPGKDLKSYIIDLPEIFLSPNKYFFCLSISTTNDTSESSPLLNQLQEVNKFLQEGSNVTIAWETDNIDISPVSFHFRSKEPVVNFRLPIFGYRELTLKNAPAKLRIDLSSKNLNLLSVKLLNKKILCPGLSLVSKNKKLVTNGSFKVEDGIALIDFDANSIAAATSVTYEVSKPNYQFELLKGGNNMETSQAYTSMRKNIPRLAGRFEIDLNKIPALKEDCFVQVRCAALDKNKEMIGCYSSNITISR